jgi:hypothetical protein
VFELGAAPRVNSCPLEFPFAVPPVGFPPAPFVGGVVEHAARNAKAADTIRMWSIVFIYPTFSHIRRLMVVYQ